jgi:hypothetical protein
MFERVPSARAAPDRFMVQGPAEPANCRDRITTAREELGQPRLERQPASPDKPLLIYAVDKRVGGCSVMVMHGNINDIRPIPEAEAPTGRLLPAR